MKHRRLTAIQLARGLAALLVAIYHTTRMMELPQYAGHKGFGGFFEFGYSGVDFFFVLSGFIIYFVHHRDLGRPKTLARYAWRRVTRIYPNYWLITATVIGLAVIKHDSSLTSPHVIRSLLLIPDSIEPMLGVAWTLIYEVIFYGAFALGILDLRLGIVTAIAWVAWIAYAHSGAHTPFFLVTSSILNLQFLLGIASAAIVLRTRIPFAPWLIGAGLLAFFGTGIVENLGIIPWASSTGHITFAVCAAIIIIGVAAAERQGQLKVGRIGEFVGGASYLLYLIHILTIGLVLQTLRALGVVHHLPDFVIVGIAVTSAAALAGVLYQYFDKPVHGVLMRLGKSV